MIRALLHKNLSKNFPSIPVNDGDWLLQMQQGINPWQTATTTNLGRALWASICQLLEEKAAPLGKLSSEFKGGFNYFDQRHNIDSVFSIGDLREVIEFSFKIWINNDLRYLYCEQEKNKAYWGREKDVRSLPSLQYFFTKEGVTRFIGRLSEDRNYYCDRFIHMKIGFFP